MDVVGEVAGDLLHPGAVGLADEVADQATEREHLDGEEVRRRDRAQMGLQEGGPWHPTAAQGRGFETVLAEDALDRVVGEDVSKVAQDITDPRVAPGRVLGGDPDNELQKRRRRTSATSSAASSAVVLAPIVFWHQTPACPLVYRPVGCLPESFRALVRQARVASAVRSLPVTLQIPFPAPYSEKNPWNSGTAPCRCLFRPGPTAGRRPLPPVRVGRGRVGKPLPRPAPPGASWFASRGNGLPDAPAPTRLDGVGAQAQRAPCHPVAWVGGSSNGQPQ